MMGLEFASDGAYRQTCDNGEFERGVGLAAEITHRLPRVLVQLLRQKALFCPSLGQFLAWHIVD
jgi:hypothetical protein